MVTRPEDFGAIGNGIADDQAALNAMFASVGTVATAPGSQFRRFALTAGRLYACSQPIKIQQSYVGLDGEGATIKHTGALAALMIDHADSINSVVGVDVRNVNIQGGTASTAHGIEAKSAPQLVLENIRIKNLSDPTGATLPGAGGSGLYVRGCVSANIINCQIDKCMGIGIRVRAYAKTWNGGTGGGVVAESQAIRIDGNRVHGSGSIGILVSEGGGMKITNNDVESNAGGGIHVRSSYDFSVTENYFEANGGSYDIDVRNLVDLVPARRVKGGRILSNQSESTYALAISDAEDVHIHHNRFSGATIINPSALRTVWGRQVEQGAFTNASPTTVVL